MRESFPAEEEKVDSTQFDRISRVIGEQPSRRGMIKASAGAALAAVGLGAFAGGALAAQGYRDDDCSQNANVCKKGLKCDTSDFTCQYTHKCGGQERGKKGNACKKNNDCCRKKNLICQNKKCKRDI
jgi:hypothetical protein